MPENFDEKLLQGRWLHSHEEDTVNRRVFRLATYPFPPSRGRIGYEFRLGGRLVYEGPGPTDRQEKNVGTWNLTEHHQLILRRPGQKDLILEIDSLEPGLLIFKK